jgi:hypothetical protein
MSQDITNLKPADPMLAFLERALRDPSFSVDKAEAVMRMLVEQQKRVALQTFNYDMNAFQSVIQQIQRDKPNPAFSSKYATYEALDKASRPIYTQYGFAVRYGTAPSTREGWIQVTCTVSHRDGWFEQHSLEGPVSPEGARGNRIGATPIQGVGIAVAYLKRYLLQMVLNLVSTDNHHDDDGEGQREGDKFKRWVDTFQDAVEKLTDSDAAKALLARDSAIRMLTEIPSGPLRQRYMELRTDVEKHWMKPIENATTQEIEGL